MLFRRFVAMAALAATCGAVISATPAAADEITSSSATVAFTSPAVLSITNGANNSKTIHFNNGQSVRVNPQQYARWQKTDQAILKRSKYQPMNTVYANCGSATVTFTARGNRHASIATSFHVNSPATDYQWKVDILDTYGVSNRTWGGVLSFRTDWAGGADFLSSGTGKATVQINTGYPSYADTLKQGFCFAGPAYASTWIT